MKKREPWWQLWFFAFWVLATAYIFATDVVASEVGKCTIQCYRELTGGPGRKEIWIHGYPPAVYCRQLCQAYRGRFQSSLPDQVQGITVEEITSCSISKSTPPTETSDTQSGQGTRCSSPAGDGSGKEKQ